MGTIVSIEVISTEIEAQAAVDRAFGWFYQIEERCSRFIAASELRQLVPGKTTHASPILFEAVRFALLVAAETEGAFDPTIGHSMAERGFNRNHRSGELTSVLPASGDVSFRDVEIDAQN